MITVSVPTFNEFDNYKFVKYVKVKIKNKPELKCLHKITKLLPGICQGGVGPKPLSDLLITGKKDVQSFYDGRQCTGMLKGYFVTVEAGE